MIARVNGIGLALDGVAPVGEVVPVPWLPVQYAPPRPRAAPDELVSLPVVGLSEDNLTEKTTMSVVTRPA